MLEKTHGSLGEHTIDFRKRSEQVKTPQVVTNIIYNGNNIKIGNDNKIIHSTTKDRNDGTSHTDIQRTNMVGRIGINISVAAIGDTILAYISWWLSTE